MNIRELSTPAVVVDLDVVDRNLERMAQYCERHGIALRPHTKTHKSLEIARKQLQLGAIGLTVAKVGEAEVMVEAGAGQILVAHPIVGAEKVRRLVALTAKAEIIVAVDSFAAAEGLARVAAEQGAELGVLVEFDSGSHRCGVQAGSECAELGKRIATLKGTRLRGLFTYFGGVWGSETERLKQIEEARSAVAVSVKMFQDAGLSTEIVSAGSTPAAEMSHLVPGITEIRPGTYVYNDLNSLYQDICTTEECAVSVIATVVSTAVKDLAIVDAGSKTFSSDRLSVGHAEGFGQGRKNPSMRISKLNEEHGFIPLSGTGRLSVGDVLEILPNHVCTCINMHDEVFTHRSGDVVGKMRVDGRGKVC